VRAGLRTGVAAAVVMYERGQVGLDDIERRWNLSGVEGVDERWRDDLLWLPASPASSIWLHSSTSVKTVS
jgi:hypothetical protein